MARRNRNKNKNKSKQGEAKAQKIYQTKIQKVEAKNTASTQEASTCDNSALIDEALQKLIGYVPSTQNGQPNT